MTDESTGSRFPATGNPIAEAGVQGWDVQQHQDLDRRDRSFWKPAYPATPLRFCTPEQAFASLWARRKGRNRVRLADCLGLEFDAYATGVAEAAGFPERSGLRVRVTYYLPGQRPPLAPEFAWTARAGHLPGASWCTGCGRSVVLRPTTDRNVLAAYEWESDGFTPTDCRHICHPTPWHREGGG